MIIEELPSDDETDCAVFIPTVLLYNDWEKKHLKKWWVYLVLGFGAKVLRFLPAASRQVKDGSGSHVSSFGIMGVVVGQ